MLDVDNKTLFMVILAWLVSLVAAVYVFFCVIV